MGVYKFVQTVNRISFGRGATGCDAKLRAPRTPEDPLETPWGPLTPPSTSPGTAPSLAVDYVCDSSFSARQFCDSAILSGLDSLSQIILKLNDAIDK